MNKLFITLLVCFISISQANSQKVGYIDSELIITLLPEVKQANSDIEVMKAMFTKKGQDMVKTLQAKYQDLQKKQASGEIAPIELDKQSAALKAEEAKLQEFEQTSQKTIYDKSEELLNPIQEKVNQAIKDVAKENGFIYIFDMSQGVVLYADPANDVTNLVKAKLGVKL